MKTTIKLEKNDDIFTMTLVPPDGRKPPTLDFDILDEMASALKEIPVTEGAAALVIRSGSERFFCGGGNLEALGEIDERTIGSWIQRGHRVFDSIEALPIPVVAVVNGYALGGGLELALACDFIYAYDSAKVGQTETRVGFVSGWGGSFRLARRIGVPRAKELFYSARILTASEAYDLGVVDYTGAPVEVEARLDRTFEEMRGNSPDAVREMKHILNRCFSEPPAAVARAEEESSIRLLRESDTLERVRAFLSRKK